MSTNIGFDNKLREKLNADGSYTLPSRGNGSATGNGYGI